LAYLLDRDPNRGRLYDVVCLFATDDACADMPVAAAHGIPVLYHPILDFCRSRGLRLTDPMGRAAYDRETVERLVPFGVDLIVLSSYLYILSRPMLTAFRHRIINVHHSDLTQRDRDGGPQWPGLRAVRDAIVAGTHYTRATVHLVTEQLDGGPPFLRSWPFPVSPLAADALKHGDMDVVRAYAWAHQEWMIRATWGPLLAQAIALVTEARLDLSDLAHVPGDTLQEPWDLAPDGGLHGSGPLPATELEGRIA
jgi:folate-dependent phosphoribosylglycinamide formyltransferase PurN